MTTMMRWHPWRELDALRREVERAFETYGARGEGDPFFRFAFLPGRAARAYPLLNLRESDDAVQIEALAPGLDPDKLSITVHNGTLRIEGEKRQLSEDIQPEAFHRRERSAGRFVRSIELPTPVDSEKVSATYQDGMLSITLPKAEAAKPKQVAVKVK